MKVGIFHYLSTAYSIDPAILAKRAEELGFDSLWLPEHPIFPVTTVSPFPLGGPIPHFYAQIIGPFVGLARASAVTQTIKLGTGICLVPERNPLLLAKEIATLDHFSGGRFIFGIGAGWVKEETESMGGDFAHRWTQTQEAIMAMKALWTKEEAEYHGSYVCRSAAGPGEGTGGAFAVYSPRAVGRLRPSARWCYVPVVGSLVRGALRRPRW